MRLVNPHETLWHGQAPQIEPLTAEVAANLDGRILLFVHGMEYGCPHEVVRDFIVPFEEGAALFKSRHRSDLQCLFIHWDSRTFGEESISLLGTLLANVTRPLQLGRFAMTTLRDVEQRATSAAKELAPLLGRLFEPPRGPRPLVITHSLGALLWAEALQALLGRGLAKDKFGDWWSMQPALAWSAFQRGGEFEQVGKLFEDEGPRKIIWYSSFDVVLACLYLLAKGRFAMGQIGAPNFAVEQHNLAFHAREAHGATCVGARTHTFFHRVGKLIERKVRELALDQAPDRLATS